MNESDRDPFELCVCPHCHGKLTRQNHDLRCNTCARCVGRAWNGILDFLPDVTALPVASGGTFDLLKDRAVAEEIARSEASLDYVGLAQLASRLRAEKPKGARALAADERYTEWYWQIEREVGHRHGHAVLAKLDAYLSQNGLGAAGGDWAIEAGGGLGGHVVGFAERFKMLVFFDCCLVNIMLGRKLAQEHGFTNVVYVRGTVEKLPFGAGAFDFVHEAGVIEHVDDPSAMVRDALRVLSGKGTYVCLSPNRFPITPEPHFKLPLFGLFPRTLRKLLLPTVRGFADESGTDLRSLNQLRSHFKDAGASPDVYFLPRRLKSTARSTPIRRFVKGALALPVLGDTVSYLLNGPLLPIMPYHVAVVHRRPQVGA